MELEQQIPTRKGRGWLKTQINVSNEADMTAAVSDDLVSLIETGRRYREVVLLLVTASFLISGIFFERSANPFHSEMTK